MKKPIYKRWWLITLVAFLVIGIIGNALGMNHKDKPSKENPKEVSEEAQDTKEENSVESIIKSNFKGSDVKIEFNKDSHDLFLTVHTKNYQLGSAAFNVEGGNLARCVGEVMEFDSDVNWQYVTIGCDSYPYIIDCAFNPEAVKGISDWKNFTQSDISSVCDAYADCKDL